MPIITQNWEEKSVQYTESEKVKEEAVEPEGSNLEELVEAA